MANSERDVPLPSEENIYDTECPILWAMNVIGQKWKLPILWYIRDKGTIRYNELRRKVVGITPTMLTKSLVELEESGLVHREQYAEIPPRVEYSLTERGKTLLPALDELYRWADAQMHAG
ncbi:MAG: helix-turn-helix domain-containing protein [Coriobacteriales bacterium]|nr:helix-turn-helix domain-containing protein [Coriobacteriales bacterium]